MPTRTGHLILADISGYTAFVADTELEHSREILNELLETIVRHLAQRLTIGQIEGDAIFALGERVQADPVGWLQECFFRFHRHLERIKRVTTCPCRACANVGALTLKFVCHHGEYMPQRFGDKETYVGNAVNMVHRLLKNSVPSREYVLVTSDTLEQLPAAERAMFARHRERYDIGAIECGWMDLSPLRSDPRAKDEVRTIEDPMAELRQEIILDAPKERVWRVLTDPAARQRWMGVQRIDYRPGARNSIVGSEYHCIHGAGEPAVLRVSEALEPDRLTIVVPTMGVFIWGTVQLEDAPGARTRMISRYRFESPGLSGKLRSLFVRTVFRFEDLAKYPARIRVELAALEGSPASA